DWMIELGTPANRGDVLGHVGVARELCAMLRGRVVLPDADVTPFLTAGPVAANVVIANSVECPRYTARMIEGVTIGPAKGHLARKIAQRLRAVGVRSISNVVDVTNYVLFELGQPLHAFDAPLLTSGTITVSSAKDGEKLTTLDKTERTLMAGDLLIRDGDVAIALAGVMGGLATEVTTNTTRVLLESASFNPVQIRRTARRLGLHSESSHRFERRVDPEIAAFASARACKLICEVAGGTIVGEIADSYPGHAAIPAIAVRLPRVRMVTGVQLEASTCKDALERLGFGVSISGEVLDVRRPSARADVEREIDVIEEILRVVGYEHVPSTLPVLRQAPGVRELDRGDAVREALAAAGLAEAITFGFQSVERNDALGLSATDRRSQPIALRNPMSADQAVMRTSLVPNLLAAITRNQSFGRPDVALFEVGSVFLRRGEGITERPSHELADEPTQCAGVLAGKRAAQLGDGAAWDVFDAKAYAERAIRAVCGGIAIKTRARHDVPYLHPGVAGALVVHSGGNDITVGVFGEVHPQTRARLGVTGPAFVFDLDLSRLPIAQPAQMSVIPKFPSSTRDVSLLLGEAIPAARISDVIDEVREPLVARVRLLEDYRDAKLGDAMKSMLWSIEYRSPERTLTVDEVDKAHEAIVSRLVERLPAQRR
ncbi:MAG TPA: phenylalanine--tRNA ligase subunit beta, partial [Kofleriaceae bacterium]